jgi:hypothetical protein
VRYDIPLRHEDPGQLVRAAEFRQEHPGTTFTPVSGLILAWVPFCSGGVQFSGRSLETALDAAEEFFSEAGPDG